MWPTEEDRTQRFDQRPCTLTQKLTSRIEPSKTTSAQVEPEQPVHPKVPITRTFKRLEEDELRSVESR